MKSAIAYEGWERLSQEEERYRLKGKRFYCHANDAIPFWEGASLEWSRVWDLSRIELMVIGGDGAGWVEEGVEEFPKAVRQLCGFHLARACCWGWEEGREIYKAIRGGDIDRAKALISEGIPVEGKRAEKARRYVRRHIEEGVDWRIKVAASNFEGARGLGAVEGNEDKLIANRMKKRGMSWTIKGAQRMAKALQLRANGEIKRWCGRWKPSNKEVELYPRLKIPKRKTPSDGYGGWLEAGMPALTGPHPSRPWVQALREISHIPALKN